MGKDNFFANPLDNLGTSKERDAQRRAQQGQILAQRDQRTAQRHLRWAIKSGDMSKINASLIGLGANKENQEAVVTAAMAAPRSVNSQNEADKALGLINNVARLQNQAKVVEYGERPATTALQPQEQLSGASPPIVRRDGSSIDADPVVPPVDSLAPAKVDPYAKLAWRDTRKKFADDLTKSDALRSGDPRALAAALKRGAALGLKEQDIRKWYGNNVNGELAAPKVNGRKADPLAVADSPESALSPDAVEALGKLKTAPGRLAEMRKATDMAGALYTEMKPGHDRSIAAFDATLKTLGNREAREAKAGAVEAATRAQNQKVFKAQQEESRRYYNEVDMLSNETAKGSLLSDLSYIPQEAEPFRYDQPLQPQIDAANKLRLETSAKATETWNLPFTQFVPKAIEKIGGPIAENMMLPTIDIIGKTLNKIGEVDTAIAKEIGGTVGFAAKKMVPDFTKEFRLKQERHQREMETLRLFGSGS